MDFWKKNVVLQGEEYGSPCSILNVAMPWSGVFVATDKAYFFNRAESVLQVYQTMWSLFHFGIETFYLLAAFP